MLEFKVKVNSVAERKFKLLYLFFTFSLMVRFTSFTYASIYAELSTCPSVEG